MKSFGREFTETHSHESIQLIVYVNGLEALTMDIPGGAVPIGYTVTFTAVMIPRDQPECIVWDGEDVNGNGLTATASWSTKGEREVTVTIGDPDEGCGNRQFAYVTVVIVKWQNHSLFPEDRERLTVGVGEKTDLITDPPWEVNWSTDCGSVAPGSGVEAVFTAPGRENTCTITWAIFSGAERQIQFTVLEPNQVTFNVLSTHTKGGWTSAGMKLRAVIHPLSVSFENIECAEWECPPDIALFCWQRIGDHKRQPWVEVGVGNEETEDDQVWAIAGQAGICPGSYKWSIPWRFRLNDEPGDGKEFTKAVQQAIGYIDGSCKITKENADSGVKLLDEDSGDWPEGWAPTDGWPDE